jgi:hypothetical protein
LIQACDWLTADSWLDFQREFYVCLAIVSLLAAWNFQGGIIPPLEIPGGKQARQLLENINKVFGISRRKFATFLH